MESSAVQVPVAAGFESLVDTDSELEQVDVEDEEVELEPEVYKSPARKLRTRKRSRGQSLRRCGGCQRTKGDFLLRLRVRLLQQPISLSEGCLPLRMKNQGNNKQYRT
jgi:hypothetical protein